MSFPMQMHLYREGNQRSVRIGTVEARLSGLKEMEGDYI